MPKNNAIQDIKQLQMEHRSCWKSNSLELLAGQALVSGNDRQSESPVPAWQRASLEQLASKELVSGARAVNGIEREIKEGSAGSAQGSLDSLEDRALVSDSLSKARDLSFTTSPEEAADEEQEAAAAGEEPECQASILELQMSGVAGESLLEQKHPQSEWIITSPKKTAEVALIDAGGTQRERISTDEMDLDATLTLVTQEIEKEKASDFCCEELDSITTVHVLAHTITVDQKVADVSNTRPNSSNWAINYFLGEISQPMASMSSLVGMNALRHLVSGDKRRLQEGPYDLDLTYITRNVIVMSMPAESITSLYRYGLINLGLSM